MQSDLIGRRLGPFEILEFTRADGLVEVYQGLDTQNDEPVQIKLAGRELQPDPVFNTRFRREARTIAGLRHPNIARLLDFGQAEGGHYMVMEHLEGVTLASLIEEVRAGERVLEPEDIAFVIRQIAAALDHAHKNDVLHLDVRPDHIVLTRSGQAILTDFGLALLNGRPDAEAIQAPTEYMAPEQIADPRSAVPASDLYALGVIVYELTTGELPYAAGSDIDEVLRHLNDTAPDPRLLDPSISPSLAAVLLKALANQPGQRFRSAMQLASSLERAYANPNLGEEVLQPKKSREKELPPPRPLRPRLTPEERREKRRVEAEHRRIKAEENKIKRAEVLARRRVQLHEFRTRWGRTVLVMAIVFLLLLAVGYILQTVGVLRVAFVLPTLAPRETEEAAEAGPTATLPPTATLTPAPSATPRPTATPLQAAGATPVPPIVFAPLDVGSTSFRIPDAQVMIFVPAGQFLMGTNDRDRADNSKPQHAVTLSDYWIDRTEITNDQYRLCVDAGTCAPPSNRVYFDQPVYGNYPVSHVTYEAAATYCLWIATQTGQIVGLPTEAQWEKAAGWDPVSEAQREYPWGNQFPDANLLRFNESPATRPAAPVGSYPSGASAYGGLDMAGNVWEWTADWFDENYYRRTGVSLDPTGPLSGSARVTRGGAWTRPGYLAATFVRNPVRPSTNSNEIGFRCAMTSGRPPAESQVALAPLDLISAFQVMIEHARGGGGDPAVFDAWGTSFDALAEALTEIDRETAAVLITESLSRVDSQRDSGQIASSFALQIETGLRWIQEQAATPSE